MLWRNRKESGTKLKYLSLSSFEFLRFHILRQKHKQFPKNTEAPNISVTISKVLVPSVQRQAGNKTDLYGSYKSFFYSYLRAFVSICFIIYQYLSVAADRGKMILSPQLPYTGCHSEHSHISHCPQLTSSIVQCSAVQCSAVQCSAVQ